MQLYSLEVPNHWLRDFFYAKASLTLLLSNDALSYYTNLSTVGFSQSPYINAQLAHANYNLESMYLRTHIHTHTPVYAKRIHYVIVIYVYCKGVRIVSGKTAILHENVVLR